MNRYPLSPESPVPPLWENYPFRPLFIAAFEKGEFLCVQDQPVENLFLIKSGKVKVCTTSPEGKNLLISFSTPGSLIGHVPLLLQSNSINSVQAATKVTCYAIPIEEFLKVARDNPEFMNHMAVLLAERIQQSEHNATINILSNLEMRLCAYIEQMQNGGFFEDNLSTLSELLGTSYRHLHRTLHTLCKKGILMKAGHGYQILDMNALSAGAGGMYRI